MHSFRIGIDLGGTKIEGIALNDAGGEMRRVRRSTPRNYDATVNAVGDIVAELEFDCPANVLPSVGVGIPGAVVPSTGLVKNANSTWLIGRPLGTDLERKLGRPVRLANDANCFTLSEATDGGGSGANVVFGVILGTGVGGGIAINRSILDGPNLIAGEWGHNPLPWPDESEYPGPACYCGKRGCIETWCSGPGFEREFAQVTGRSSSSRAIVRAAVEMSDDEAVQALARYTRRLAKSLATVINILDPDVIVLGGGMSNINRLAQRTHAQLGDYVFSDASGTRIVHNVHGDSSGVRGAAWLWPNNL
jgi:fructokinase